MEATLSEVIADYFAGTKPTFTHILDIEEISYPRL
jgi:hypothetical protein